MKVWLPYITAGSGSDVSTRYLAAGLEKVGIEVVLQSFHHYFEIAPWLLSKVQAPPGTDITVTNSWNGFAFKRRGTKMITVDRLFVPDPTLNKYKSKLQYFYHNHHVKRNILASIKSADSVVAVSNYTAQVMAREFNIPKPRVILNAVDTEFFTPKEDNLQTDKDRPFRLLFVGNLTRRKGVDLLGPIMNQLGPEYELYYTAGLRTSALPDTTSTMHALGTLSQEEIREQYRLADLLLFPSRGEGLSRAVMESLACGTPVIAADISSLPEAVSPDVGRLCPVDDAAAFANAVHELSAEPERLTSMRKAARKRAQEVFSLKRMVNEYIDLFEEAFKKQRI